MEAQKPLEQETPETTPQEVPTATIPQPESTPAANMEADPVPEEMDASPESPAKKTAGKLAALIGGGIVAVLGIFYLVLCIVSASHGTILGRTDVMGVDMSGLTVPQAQERWQQKGQAVCQAAQLPLTLDGETAGQVSLWELGVSVTPETAAQLAYNAGHSGHFLENGWSLLRSWFRETSLTPPWTADDAALQEKAAELAEQLDVAAIDGACRLEQGKEDGFLVTVPKNGSWRMPCGRRWPPGRWSRWPAPMRWWRPSPWTSMPLPRPTPRRKTPPITPPPIRWRRGRCR